MDKNLMSLSFSLEANKGVYALLLGSGISSSAGIPTGWGILDILCSRIMKLNGSNEKDAIKWYEEKYNKIPLYGEVIELIGKTPTERSGLLEEFFEPTEEDIAQNKKLPTEAHKSIAELVKQGYIKVIITTNFDRLIEKALGKLNVQCQVLNYDSDIEGMKPLDKVDCTVLKINGDCRDIRFKNIPDELKGYSKPLTEMLDRIFDEYGLIISGWSAEWDTALRRTIKSTKGRRYSWYWHSYSNEISKKAQELVDFRDATVIIDNGGADHFFKEVKENVMDISNLKRVNPNNLQVQVKRLKNYISNDKSIEIRDMITEETKQIIDIVKGMNTSQEVTIDLVTQWVEETKALITPLSILMAILSYHGSNIKNNRLIIETFERFTTISDHKGDPILLSLKEIPLQAIFYSVGISSVMSENYDLLNKIFIKPQVRDRFCHDDFLRFMSPRGGLHRALQFLKDKNYYSPFEAIFMQPFMEEIFLDSQLVLDKYELIVQYDIFEFLRALKHHFIGNNDYRSGVFGYRDDRIYIERFLSEGNSQENWNVLLLFENSKIRFSESLQNLVNDLNSQPYFNGNGLLEAYNANT